MTSVWTVSFVTGGISADFVQLKPGFRLWLDLLQQGSIKFQLCLDKICKCMFKIMKNFRGTISQINFKKELFRTHLKQRVPSRLMTASARNGGLIIRPHFTGIIYLLPLPLITLQKGFSKVLPHSILVCGLHATKNQPKNFLSLFIYWLLVRWLDGYSELVCNDILGGSTSRKHCNSSKCSYRLSACTIVIKLMLRPDQFVKQISAAVARTAPTRPFLHFSNEYKFCRVKSSQTKVVVLPTVRRGSNVVFFWYSYAGYQVRCILVSLQVLVALHHLLRAKTNLRASTWKNRE